MIAFQDLTKQHWDARDASKDTRAQLTVIIVFLSTHVKIQSSTPVSGMLKTVVTAEIAPTTLDGYLHQTILRVIGQRRNAIVFQDLTALCGIVFYVHQVIGVQLIKMNVNQCLLVTFQISTLAYGIIKAVVSAEIVQT